ncbi:MAG: RNA polymerase sigma factor [Gemmatimonadales bacterium]|nr:RNA polymerase sigma factor [Gemmatimonadales bacterium]
MEWARAGRGTAPDPTSDGQLVERVLQGEVAAFDELALRYERRAYALAYRLLRHREDAEDLVQECFMTALDKLDTFQTGRQFGPWFFRILVNRGLNQIASRRRRETDVLSEETAGGGESPERAAEQAELRIRVAEALAGLSERQRLVLQFHELDGYSSAEVAEMLDIAQPTVRWTLHIARKRLRKILAPLREEDGNV